MILPIPVVLQPVDGLNGFIASQKNPVTTRLEG
jgi:hypothetical protein